MEIKLTLALPRDALSVPVVRRVLRGAMETLGVVDEVISSIEVALTEAATNVLDHALESDQYEVSAGIDGDLCVIEVVDRETRLFDGDDKGLADAADAAEEGRGIQLIRALVDKVEFTSRPQTGTVVHLEKALEWNDGAPGRTLAEAMPEERHGPWSDDEDLEDAPEPR
ncbi:MAG: putative serine/threonine kinase anti-sigma factor [Frankiales bacterium]|nr:putative serine/threonine kinase anti-sigma factor [Frankiales bacterium]